MPASRAATPQGAEFCGAGGTYESAVAVNTMITKEWHSTGIKVFGRKKPRAKIELT